MTARPQPIDAGAGSGTAAPAARILVVEDDDDARCGMVVSLTAAGYQVASCSDGRSAIAEFRANRPDLVILDLGLPEVDGLTALRQLSADAPDAKFIVLSAWDETVFETSALDAGATIYLEKPVTGRRLASAINILLA